MQKLLYSGKVVVFGQSGFVRAKWFYSGKMVLFGQSCCDREGRLFWGKVFVIGQELLYSGKRGCIRANWF